MSKFIFTYRQPANYVPSQTDPNVVSPWTKFFEGIGSRIVEPGQPVFERAAFGEIGGSTKLAGYSIVEADSLDAGLALARECPAIEQGGGVEVGARSSRRRAVIWWIRLSPARPLPSALIAPGRSRRTSPSSAWRRCSPARRPSRGSGRTRWSGVDAITEVPPDRWDWRLYYDPDPKAPDKIISKWGGFLPDVAFDPLALRHAAVEPAVDRAGAVAGAGGRAHGAGRCRLRRATVPPRADGRRAGHGRRGGATGDGLRVPLVPADARHGDPRRPAARRSKPCRGQLPEWTEDSFPGFLLNVTAGRIANRLNLGGANYTVDAACGSSLAAAALAVRELETGAADMVILGGVDTVQNPFTYLAFSKTQAFSPRGRCRPFDAGANGIVISEGVAALVLKRLADAERDGDRIYAVIKGVGASSDGRARGLTAPVVEGQVRATRARLRQGRRLAGDGRLRRGARHRHGAGRRRRGRGAGSGLPPPGPVRATASSGRSSR